MINNVLASFAPERCTNVHLRLTDDDGLDVGIGEQCIEIIGDGGVRVVFGHLLADGAGLVADGFEGAKLMEVPDKVLAPVARADDGDISFRHEIYSFCDGGGVLIGIIRALNSNSV